MDTLGAFVRDFRPRIVRAWADEAQLARAARGLSRSALESAIPKYVESVARDGAIAERRELLRNHPAARQESGVRLAELVEELAILGRVVDRIWAEAAEERRPGAAQMRGFHAELADAVSWVAEASHEKRLADGKVTLQDENAHLRTALATNVDTLTKERAMRERFVALLARDLRGPLAAARAGTKLLMKAINVPDDERDAAVRVDAALDGAERMLQDLLDAALVRLGERLPLEITEVDPNALACEVVEELQSLHGRQRFVLRANAPQTVFWSAQQVRRALRSLLLNALEYGDPEAPITATLDGTDVVLLSVNNLGPGLTVEDSARVLDPFMRATTRDPCNGWGVGLTLVRGCAEAHGGQVDVTSSQAAGTTFTLRLPRDARGREGTLPVPAPVGASTRFDDAPQPADEGDVRLASVVRSDALALHAVVRSLVRSVLRSIRRLERGDVSSPEELRVSLNELVAGLRRMHVDEATSLEPALRALDAWGDHSVEALRAQHLNSMTRLSGVRTEASSSRQLASQARDMVRVVLRALRLEQATVLGLDRWADELSLVNQEAG